MRRGKIFELAIVRTPEGEESVEDPHSDASVTPEDDRGQVDLMELLVFAENTA